MIAGDYLWGLSDGIPADRGAQPRGLGNVIPVIIICLILSYFIINQAITHILSDLIFWLTSKQMLSSSHYRLKKKKKKKPEVQRT